MDKIGAKILMLCNEFQAQGYVLITVCCIVIGVILSMSEDGTEKLKKRLPCIVIGWILCLGAVTLGAQYAGSLRF